jgi:hypothetical protein
MLTHKISYFLISLNENLNNPQIIFAMNITQKLTSLITGAKLSLKSRLGTLLYYLENTFTVNPFPVSSLIIVSHTFLSHILLNSFLIALLNIPLTIGSLTFQAASKVARSYIISH